MQRLMQRLLALAVAVLTASHAAADAVHQALHALIVQVAELRAWHAGLLPVRVAVQRKLT
jgi:hypothetical protein